MTRQPKKRKVDAAMKLMLQLRDNCPSLEYAAKKVNALVKRQEIRAFHAGCGTYITYKPQGQISAYFNWRKAWVEYQKSQRQGRKS